MDIGKSISFVFEDEQWLQKVLIGGLILLATIFFFWTVIGLFIGIGLLLGYGVDVLKNVRRGDPYPLPEWDNWGDKIVKGIKLMFVFFIWAIPVVIVLIPTTLLGSFTESGDSGALVGLLITCLSCLMVLYSIILTVLSPAIIIKFAENERVVDAFDFAEIFSFTRENIGEIIIAVLVLWAVQIVASIVGSILCGIGLLFTTFWTYAVQFHLFGQIGLDKGLLEFDGGSSYDLSPDDVMPGVGETIEKVGEGAEDAILEVQDLGDSILETSSDAGDEGEDDTPDQADEPFEKLP
ncbi:MAG: DUF4013 domain-containing protein [Chloroflexi bacterium]|nr:DUF4013 domain-containing protein [Chloroflexota bacterium]